MEIKNKSLSLFDRDFHFFRKMVSWPTTSFFCLVVMLYGCQNTINTKKPLNLQWCLAGDAPVQELMLPDSLKLNYLERIQVDSTSRFYRTTLINSSKDTFYVSIVQGIPKSRIKSKLSDSFSFTFHEKYQAGSSPALLTLGGQLENRFWARFLVLEEDDTKPHLLFDVLAKDSMDAVTKLKTLKPNQWIEKCF